MSATISLTEEVFSVLSVCSVVAAPLSPLLLFYRLQPNLFLSSPCFLTLFCCFFSSAFCQEQWIAFSEGTQKVGFISYKHSFAPMYNFRNAYHKVQTLKQ